MAGIKETKELLEFIIRLGEAVDRSMEDGEIGFMDMSNLVSAMLSANAAFSDISLIPAEIKDLSKEESEELYAYVRDELDLDSDKIEMIVENALEIGMKVFQLILAIRGDAAPAAPAA
jgi:hypothetical protein